LLEDELNSLNIPAAVVPSVKIFIAHHQQHNALDQADDATQAKTTQQEHNDACRRVAQVEVVDTQTAEEDSKDAGDDFAFFVSVTHLFLVN
jgi:hypothetical protein